MMVDKPALISASGVASAADAIFDLCCRCSRPASPAVVIMLPGPGRERADPADLLLCGLHYRVHSRALAGASAAAFDAGGTPLTRETMLLVQAGC